MGITMLPLVVKNMNNSSDIKEASDIKESTKFPTNPRPNRILWVFGIMMFFTFLVVIFWLLFTKFF